MRVPKTLCEGLVGAIPKRCSWRRYTGEDLSEYQKESLKAYSTDLNKVFKYARLQIVEGEMAKTAMTSPIGIGVIRGIVFCAAVVVNKDSPRPETDIEAGMIGQLFILKAISLDLQNVWIGAVNILGQSKVLRKSGLVNCETESIIAFLPVGHAVNPEYGQTRRPPLEKFLVCPPSMQNNPDVQIVANAVLRSPSALNRMPYKLIVKPTEDVNVGGPSIASIQLNVFNSAASGSYLSHWLDAGIGAVHALLAFQTLDICTNKDAIEVSYLLGNENAITLTLQTHN
ncbi:Hypothetical protein GLP15_4322 [Giardia lamblia P15]|uniref:Putative nitroreductase TM1586 domain-containing protein n=1 Tax=Giardia intestinalis (strain P15) TaxID=658858 RepID=E1EWU8_GIAIA|nr:Hypothetical protein GLP15_4322 [Giardia lamblia P15]